MPLAWKLMIAVAIHAILTHAPCAMAQDLPPLQPAEQSAFAAIREKLAAAFGETSTPLRERRYVAEQCPTAPLPPESPFWSSVLQPYSGLPVFDCSKDYGAVKGRALVVLPSSEKAARWLLSACLKAGQTKSALAGCLDNLNHHVTTSNGWQFIVAGVIEEPAHYGYSGAEWADKACANVANQPLLFSFVDGITSRLAGRPRTSWREPLAKGCVRLSQPTDEELKGYLLLDPDAAGGVRNVGRIAGLSRSLYAACKQLAAPLSDSDWRAIVRTNLVTAWTSGDDALLDLLALAKFHPSGGCRLD